MITKENLHIQTKFILILVTLWGNFFLNFLLLQFLGFNE